MRIICAYNVNLDAVHSVRGSELSGLLSRLNASPKIEIPERISSVDDFLSGLLFCMKTGSGAELFIDDQEVASAIKNSFSWGNRLGGNAGNMANVLAALGAEPVLNVPALTKKLASLLDPNIRVPMNRKLASPADAVRDDEGPVHFVLQFGKGEVAKAPGEDIISPRENRLIATYDDLNRRIYTDPDFDAYCEEQLDEVDGALVAGFHLVPYSNYKELLDRRISQIGLWKRKRPDLFIHAEMGNFQMPEIAMYLLERLQADSIGMNEDELAMLTGFEPGWRGIIEAARRVMSRFKISRVCVHTREYVVSAVSLAGGMVSIGSTVRGLRGPKEEISALERGTEVAASLAASGSLTGVGRVTRESEVAGKESVVGEGGMTEKGRAAGECPALNISAVGASAVNDLCIEGAERFGRGAFVGRGDEFYCLVPSLNVSRPRMVVGLGDTMTAATFFYELVLR